GRIDEIAFAENPPRGFNKRAARHRRVRLLAEALDQPHAETPLEFADLQTDRRLRQIEMARRGRKTAALDHSEQRVQLIEIEAAHPKRALSKSLKHKICLIREVLASSGGGASHPIFMLGEIICARFLLSLPLCGLPLSSLCLARVP